ARTRAGLDRRNGQLRFTADRSPGDRTTHLSSSQGTTGFTRQRYRNCDWSCIGSSSTRPHQCYWCQDRYATDDLRPWCLWASWSLHLRSLHLDHGSRLVRYRLCRWWLGAGATTEYLRDTKNDGSGNGSDYADADCIGDCRSLWAPDG